MRVSKSGALAMTAIAVLWAVTPAIACLVQMHPMTPAEHECCLKMAQQCGSSVMPPSHSCCQGHQRDTAVSPVPTYPPKRPFAVAIVPPSSIVLVDSALNFPHVAGTGSPTSRVVSGLYIRPANLDLLPCSDVAVVYPCALVRAALTCG